jgi:hypothetical protein
MLPNILTVLIPAIVGFAAFAVAAHEKDSARRDARKIRPF